MSSSSQEYVEQLLDRIDSVQSGDVHINAVCTLHPDALGQAAGHVAHQVRVVGAGPQAPDDAEQENARGPASAGGGINDGPRHP